MNLLSRVKGNALPAGYEPGEGITSGKDVLREALRRDAVFRPTGLDDPAANPGAARGRDGQPSVLIPTLSATRVAASEEAQTRYADLLFNAHRLGGSGS